MLLCWPLSESPDLPDQTAVFRKSLAFCDAPLEWNYRLHFDLFARCRSHGVKSMPPARCDGVDLTSAVPELRVPLHGLQEAQLHQNEAISKRPNPGPGVGRHAF